MRRVPVALVVVAVLLGLVILLWPKPQPAADEGRLETEVAVRVGKITRTTLRAYVTAYGLVEPEPPGAKPAASARVTPTVPGVVTAVSCTEGRHVEKGELLFQLDSRVAAVAADRARKVVAFAEATFERQKKLMQVDGTSQKLLLEAEQALAGARNDLAAAETQLALLRVGAPLSGTLARVNARPGEAVDLTTTLAEVVDLDRLVVSASVPSTELAPLRVGQLTEAVVDRATAPVRGWLSFVSPQLDAKTGSAEVRASLPARSGLRPGQLVTLRIVSSEHKDCLAVPVESVVKDSEGGSVVALVQNGKAVQTRVRAGLRDAGLVEIEGEGLKVDQLVVTEGAYALPKETRIRVLGQ